MNSRRPPSSLLALLLVAVADTLSPRNDAQDAEVGDRTCGFADEATAAWTAADDAGNAPPFDLFGAALITTIRTHGPTHSNAYVIQRAMSLATCTATSADALWSSTAAAAPPVAAPPVAAPPVAAPPAAAPPAAPPSAFATGNG